MPGATFGVVNRALVGTWSVATGSLVSGYSVQALNDWRAGNQIRVTPSANQVTLKCILPAAPSSASHTQWRVTHFGMVNHNLDGAQTIALHSHTADNFGASTSRASSQFAANMSNPNFLFRLDDFGGGANSTAARYWWVDITDAALVSPVRIGVIFIGLALDLGYPVNGYRREFQPTGGLALSPTGIPVTSRLSPPIVTCSYQFDEPDKVLKSTVNDYAVATSTTYPTYPALGRLLEEAREVPIDATTVYSGVSAGGGMPVLYHEGDGVGLSTFGRPAFYGSAQFSIQNHVNARQHPVSVSVQWHNDANNKSLNPADD